MKNFKITQKKLIDFIENSSYSFEITDAKEWYDDAVTICDNGFSKNFIKNNLATIEDVSDFYGKGEFLELDNETKIKILASETLRNCAWAKMFKLEHSKFIPGSLSIVFEIEELITKKDRIEMAKAKENYDNRPLVAVEEMEAYIETNKAEIKEELEILDVLKSENRKEEWHVKMNALVQKVANNDFRTLGWQEIRNLIKSKVQ